MAHNQSRQMKELVFLQDVRSIEEAEKEREFKASQEWIGETPLRPEQVQQVLHARSDGGTTKLVVMLTNNNMIEGRLDDIHWLVLVTITRREQALQHERDRREEDRTRIEPLVMGPVEAPPRCTRAESMVGEVPPHQPEFDIYKADDWKKRTATLRVSEWGRYIRSPGGMEFMQSWAHGGQCLSWAALHLSGQ